MTPGCALLNNLLYESPLGSQLIMMYDSNKRLVTTVDFEPKDTSVEKGKYTLSLQLRHHSLKLLQGLKNTCLVMTVHLSKSISLDAYSSLHDAVLKGPKFSPRLVLRKGMNAPVFFPPLASLPDHVKAGDVLLGKASFGVSHTTQGRPYSVPASLTVGTLASSPKQKYDPLFAEVKEETEEKKEKKEETANEAAEKSVPDAKPSLEDKLRDMQLKYVSGLSDAKEQQAALEALLGAGLAQHKDHLPLLELQLTVLTKTSPQSYQEIISAVDQIVAQIHQKDLAAELYFPVNGDEKKQALQKKNKTLKNTLVNVLKIKAKALESLLEAHDSSSASTSQADLLSQFNETFALLQDWVEAKAASQIVELKVSHSKLQGKYGAGLTALGKEIAKSPTKALTQSRLKLFKQMGGFYL